MRMCEDERERPICTTFECMESVDDDGALAALHGVDWGVHGGET